MRVKEGESLPQAAFMTMGSAGPEIKTTNDVFRGRRVALFGLPGAYTPVCHAEHLPGIVALQKTLRQHGIDVVACTAVNDVFVLDRWANELGAQSSVLMLADGNADFAIRAGLAVDLTKYGLGIRSNRYALLAADGEVRVINVEDVLMRHDKSSAASLCERIDQVSA